MNRYTVLLALALVLILVVAGVVSYLKEYHRAAYDKWAGWLVIASTIPGLSLGVYIYIKGPRPRSGDSK